MPIKPENAARYPKDWPQIRAAMMERAGRRCEHNDAPGHRCTARQYAVGQWQMADLWRLPVGFEGLQRRVWRFLPMHGNGPTDAAGQGLDWPSLQPLTYSEARSIAADADWEREHLGAKPLTVIVLTCAHLDHQPENCDPANLRMLCQRHHLAHDHHHHRANAQATRRAKAGTLELFE